MSDVSRVLKAANAVLDKDVRSEFRTKYALNAILLFAVTTLTVVSFAVGQFGLTPEIQAALYWIIVFFSAMSGLSRAFVREEEAGTVHALKLAAEPTVVYLGKLAYNLILMGILEAVVFPLFVVMMGLRVENYALFFAVLVLGSAGLASLATIIAAIVAKANAKGTLFTILSFPPLLPLLVTCIGGTRLALEGADVSAAAPEIRVLIAYSMVIVVASLMLFEFVWND
jgi:heme exporter protein B